jgi:4-hydroxy-tetrahydrodipicolinate reductase
MTKKVNVVMAGLPGNMAKAVAQHLLRDERFHIVPGAALTGPDISESEIEIDGLKFSLISPDQHKKVLISLQFVVENPVVVDFTHPSAVNRNAELYCNLGIPFVMGTTGGKRDELLKTVEESLTCAVIAPNMAKQIVGFQATMHYMAATFPKVFEGYTLEIVESHQNGKADTSGTAMAMVEQPDGSPGIFNQLGIPFKKDQIRMVRDPKVQTSELGVPEEYLAGHGWHTYILRSKDGTVILRFTHNVNGRDVYALGTIDALLFLANKVEQGAKGEVFSMVDVLKG